MKSPRYYAVTAWEPIPGTDLIRTSLAHGTVQANTIDSAESAARSMSAQLVTVDAVYKSTRRRIATLSDGVWTLA